MMSGGSAAITGQHTVLMTEMEDTYGATSANENMNGLPSSSDRGNFLKIQLWRKSDGNVVGSAARPIELGDDDDDPMVSGKGAAGAGNAAGGKGGGGGGGGISKRALFGHAVRPHELSPGDQVYVYRGAIQHHGIVTHVPQQQEQEMLKVAPLAGYATPSLRRIHVVHFDSNCDGVETTTLEAFLQGGALRRATYSSSKWLSGVDFGASYAYPADDPALIVKRANEAAKFGDGASGWSGYSLLTNNCETFACWCSTGRRQTLSRQATRGLVGAGVVAASVSAVASAGSFATAAGGALAMVPRGVQGIHRTVKAVEWATGVAVVAVSLADAVSILATKAPNERNSQSEL